MTQFADSAFKRPDSCTVFWQSTVAEASLHLCVDLLGIEISHEMMLPRFSSAGCRIQPLYRSTSVVILQLFPFPPTNYMIHSRERKVAGTTRGITYNISPSRRALPTGSCRTKKRASAIEGHYTTGAGDIFTPGTGQSKPPAELVVCTSPIRAYYRQVLLGL